MLGEEIEAEDDTEESGRNVQCIQQSTWRMLTSIEVDDAGAWGAAV
jgi:hypothetical protein